MAGLVMGYVGVALTAIFALAVVFSVRNTLHSVPSNEMAAVMGAEKVTVFALVASPVQPGFTGKRYFFLDEGGVIRQADSQIIGPRSDPVNDPVTGTENDDEQ